MRCIARGETVAKGSIRSILRGCFLVSATVILVRILWVFVSTYLPLAVNRRLRQRTPFPPWQEPALISWVCGLKSHQVLQVAHRII